LKGLTQRIEQILPIFTLECNNLTASTADIRIDIERLPQVVYGRRTGLSADIEQDADVRLQNWAKGIEEPPMRVDLFLVLFLKAEDDLDWYDTPL
jgi:hypothetical protein